MWHRTYTASSAATNEAVAEDRREGEHRLLEETGRASSKRMRQDLLYGGLIKEWVVSTKKDESMARA